MADTQNTSTTQGTSATGNIAAGTNTQSTCYIDHNDTPVIPAKSASKRARTTLVIIFSVLSVFLFYFLFVFWPSNSATTQLNLPLFCWKVELSQEQQYFLLVVFGGALGASLQVILSATTFIGNGKLVDRWIPWYYLRPFIGAGLALIFYLLIRGGLLSYTPNNDNSLPTSTSNTSIAVKPVINYDTVQRVVALVGYTDAVDSAKKTDSVVKALYPTIQTIQGSGVNTSKPVPVNPFGIIAVACLAGLFSNEASNKLKKVFEALFTGDNNKNGLMPKNNTGNQSGNTPTGQGNGGGTQTPGSGGAQTTGQGGTVNTPTSTTTTATDQGQGSGTQSTTPDGGTQSGQPEGNNTQPGTPATGV